jgi:hypothetical protein
LADWQLRGRTAFHPVLSSGLSILLSPEERRQDKRLNDFPGPLCSDALLKQGSRLQHL